MYEAQKRSWTIIVAFRDLRKGKPLTCVGGSRATRSTRTPVELLNRFSRHYLKLVQVIYASNSKFI